MSQASQAQILIGQTAEFTGAVDAGVKETTDGARLYIDSINAKGGIGGQKIELISMDDKFEPKLAAENGRKLIEEKTVGAMVRHLPVQKHVFNVRATYQRKAEKAVTHLKSMGITKIARVYPDDSFGSDGLAGAQKGMVTAKLTPVAVEKFNRSKPDFTTIAPLIYKANAHAVIMIASSQAVVEGVKALRAAACAAQVVTLSNNASSDFTKSLGDNGRGVIVTQVFLSERSIAYPMVKEALELAKAKPQTKPSPAMLVCAGEGAGGRLAPGGPQTEPRKNSGCAGRHSKTGYWRAGSELRP